MDKASRKKGRGKEETTGSTTPIVLVTTGGLAQARVPWENRDTETFRARRATLRSLQRREPDGGVGSALRIAGRVRPGETGELRLSLRLPPHTPPGRYSVSVQVGDRTLPVTIVVPEERQIVLTPHVLKLEGPPGSVCSTSVVVENRGNVPLVLEPPAPTLIEERGHLHAILWRALQKSPSDRYEDFLNTLVAEAKETTSPHLSRFIRVQLDDAPRLLEPGQAAVISLRVKIPAAVRRGYVFRARVSLAGVPLQLNVLSPRTARATLKMSGRKT